MPNLFDFGLVFRQIPTLLQALPQTLLLTFVSMFAGLALGIVLAIIKIHKVPVLSQITAVFVSFIRGTPLIVQLYLSYYGIPLALKYINYYNGTSYDVNFIPNIYYAFLALILNEAAYNSETVRAAILSVDKGQIEAGHSLGMTGFQLLKRVIFPQAGLVALPSLGNSLISLLKGTSLVFVTGVVEITARGNILAGFNYRFFEVYISLAIIYWVLSFLMEQTIKWVERKLTIPDEVGTLQNSLAETTQIGSEVGR